ncbi:MAG TPA: tyrosine-type recombinase/integrase [Gemmataceae bacterium]|nr:tyrosine-type recombinase/integrase [Gemmataceae bacterium]
MARHAKPWWWEERQGYYAFVRGARLRLGDTKKQAEDELKRLLKEGPVEVADRTLLAVLLDDFLDFVRENRAPKTYRGYLDFCQSFLKKFPKLKIDELSPDHITEWLKGHKTWNSTTKRGAITCLQRALNWARKNKGLKVNVLAGMEKPLAKTRTTVITNAEFKALLSEVKDREFKDLLIFSYDCGCRPQESKRLEARHLDLAKKRAVLPATEAKGKRAPRAIYIPTARALKIIKERMKAMPEGPIFRNYRGRPWTASAVKCRFAKLEEKLGKRYQQYAFRHTWITQKLIAGVDSHVVAALSGHSDSSMIDRVYSHVADDHKFMLQAASKVAKS